MVSAWPGELVADHRPAARHQGDDVTVVLDRLDHHHGDDSRAIRVACGLAARYWHSFVAVLSLSAAPTGVAAPGR
jgi:hypothetical protein